MTAHCAIEPLEPRRMLTIFINGTAGVDTLIVNRSGSNINVNLNGTPSTIPIGANTDLQINALGSNDTITVTNLADLDLRVFCGSGNDTLTIGGSGLGSFNFSTTTLSGEGGTDTVNFVDGIEYISADTQRYELAGGVFRTIKEVFLGGQITASHEYDTFESVTITAGGEDSQFDVFALGGESTVQINAGNGGDTLRLRPTLTSASITFDGQGDSTLPISPDRVFIDDSLPGGAAGDIYTLDESSFDRTGFGLLNFVNVDELNVTTHNLGVVVNIVGVIQGFGNTIFTTKLNCGAGNDAITIGAGDYEINADAQISVNGGGGNDSLTVDDGLDNGSDHYSINGNLFMKENMNQGMNFSAIENFTLRGNFSPNTYEISTQSASVVNVIAKASADTFRVTPSPNSTLNINGAGPATLPGDTLIFEAAEAAGSCTFAAGTYQFESAAQVVITNIETFPLPPAAPSAPDLRPEDDSGVSFTDNITNDNTPTFTGTAPANLTVLLKNNATVLGTTTASAGGAWSITSSPLADGVRPITAAARIAASGLTGPRSPVLNVTIDTVAPSNPTTAPDLNSNSDTGLSSTDNITADNTPQFDGQVPINEIVRLFADGVLVGTDTTTPVGLYSIVTTPLADGVRQIVSRFEDIAGNQSGLSPALTVTIDTVAPAAPTVAPDMTAATDTGVSNTDNITRNIRPVFTGSRPADVAVLLTQGNVIFGQVLTVGPTSYTITSSTLADGSYNFAARFRDIAGNDSGPGPALAVTIDTVAPTLTNQTFNFLTSQNLRFAFSEDVGPTLGPADFSLTATPGGVVPAASTALAYAANTATFTFPGFPGGVLPDADYRAKIEGAGAVTDIAGNAFAGTELLFFFLNGDANRDRVVNLADFNILAANFGQSNRTFGQGDFNYDGVVNLADFNILASRFGFVLSGSTVSGGDSSQASSPFATATRITDWSRSDDALTKALA